jgi:hypothetical protein
VRAIQEKIVIKKIDNNEERKRKSQHGDIKF